MLLVISFAGVALMCIGLISVFWKECSLRINAIAIPLLLVGTFYFATLSINVGMEMMETSQATQILQ